MSLVSLRISPLARNVKIVFSAFAKPLASPLPSAKGLAHVLPARTTCCKLQKSESCVFNHFRTLVSLFCSRAKANLFPFIRWCTPHPMTTQLQFNLQPDRRSLSVSELTARIRDLLAKDFNDISVEGEISNCREAQSGHFYLTLKDEKAQIRCVWFKHQMRGVKFRPEDGLKVTVRGSISVYEQRGEYQIYVESMEPAGRGALQLAFEQLKKRLKAEGLFDP